MQYRISQIHQTYLAKIKTAGSLEKLDEIFLSLFGKSGIITALPKEFSKLTREQLLTIGPLFNEVKTELEQEIENQRYQVREKGYKLLANETFKPAGSASISRRQGYIHPVTQFGQDIVKIFSKLGFVRFDAPHIDSDFNNFEVLNIPADHPARDLWDTLYIDSKNQEPRTKLLLRTHTSNSQIRIMEKYKPPIRMMNLGRCFRYENVDARHEHTFDQFELVYVDKNLSMANLQYLSEYFLKTVLGQDTKVRLRPKYYPFVEPGVGIDGTCLFCKGRGCKVCGEIGWLELGGAGMIHPQVLKNGGINPKIYSGIAWGPGLERILMLKHNINDLRLFRSGDLKFLQRERFKG